MSRPRISSALRSASPGSSASLIPPAFPRPPVSTCALTTTCPPISSAAARAAPYAVGFADASLDWLSWKRRFRPIHLLLLTLVLAELVLTGGWRPALVLYPLVGFTFLRLRAPRLRKRAAAGRELNAELARQ